MIATERFPPEGFYRIDEAFSHWMEIVHGHETLLDSEKDEARFTFVAKMREQHHRVCLLNEKSEKLAIPHSAWNPEHFPDLIPLSPSISQRASGPWEGYRGCIVIVPKDDLKEWAVSQLRDRLFDKVANGFLQPREAEVILDEKGLAPLLEAPSTEGFHPEKEVFWTLPMAAAWIVWRDLKMVTRQWEKYTKHRFYWRESRGPGQEKAGFIPEPVPTPSLQLLRLSLSLENRVGGPPMRMQANEMLADLERKLQGKELVAIGTKKVGKPVEIPTVEWAGLHIVEHRGRDALMLNGTLDVVYESILLPSKVVMALWLPPSAMMAIWDFALAKRDNNKDQAGRLVADFYSAFWRGEFGNLELALVQDRLFNPGAEVFEGFARELLAGVAIGGERLSRLGIEAALAELAMWNLSDYGKVRDEYRYYFLPDGGIGSIKSQRRGLCAPREVLQKWLSSKRTGDEGQSSPELEKQSIEAVGKGPLAAIAHRPPQQRAAALSYLKRPDALPFSTKLDALVEDMKAKTGLVVSRDTMRRAKQEFSAEA